MTDPTGKNWIATKAKIKARFGKLTDDNIDAAKDNLDLLKGKIQSAYGFALDQAEKEYTNFIVTLSSIIEPLKVAEVPVATPAPHAKVA